MSPRGAHVGAIGIEQRLEDDEARLRVPRSVLPSRGEESAEAHQALRRDGRRGAVNGFVVVERIGRAAAPVAERGEAGSAGIPVRNAVGGGTRDVVIAGRRRGLDEGVVHGADRIEKLELLRKTQHGPGEAAGPGGKGRVALLAARSTVGTADDVEEALVGNTAARVVHIAAAPVKDGVLGGGARVLQETVEQADARILLLDERVPELMRQGERAQRADRVDEERMRSVERVDEASARNLRPPGGLDRAAHLQRELVERDLIGGRIEPPRTRQPPEIAVGADVVESVVVDADVREVGRHAVERPRPSQFQERALAGRVELHERGSELKALRPFRPAARAIAAVDREHGRAIRRVPGLLDRRDLFRRPLEEMTDRRPQIFGTALASESNHFVSNAMMRTRSSDPTCLRPCELPVRVRIAAPAPTSVGFPSSVMTPLPLRT